MHLPENICCFAVKSSFYSLQVCNKLRRIVEMFSIAFHFFFFIFIHFVNNFYFALLFYMNLILSNSFPQHNIVFDFTDAPLCVTDKVVIVGAFRNENLNIYCEVQADPPPRFVLTCIYRLILPHQKCSRNYYNI